MVPLVPFGRFGTKGTNVPLADDLTGADGDFRTHVVVCPKGM